MAENARRMAFYAFVSNQSPLIQRNNAALYANIRLQK
jgi:hypothetical protein